MANPLMPHQIEAVHQAYLRIKSLQTSQLTGGYYLAHAPGVGKTLSGIVLIRMLKAKRVVVITNVAGLGVWKQELDKWWGEGHYHTGNVLLQYRQVTIHTYDEFGGKEGPKKLNRLIGWHPDLIILDEAHKIKSPSSDRSKTLARLIASVPHRLLMSGTPAHDPLDWWAQYRYVDPQNARWAQSFTQYKKHVAIYGGPTNQWITGFVQATKDQILDEMQAYTHIATQEVLKLEAPLETIVPVTLSPRELDAYSGLAREAVYESDEGVTTIANPMLRPMRLHQVTSGWLLTDPDDPNPEQSGWNQGERAHVELGNSKLTALRDLLEERSQEKVVVSAYFRKDVQRICELLKQMARSHDFITGAMTARRRTEIVEEFQTTQEPQVLVIQQQAGGEALTLTAARFLVLYSLAPSVIALQQVIGRIWRKGQTGAMQVLYLSGSKNDLAMWEGLKQGIDGVSLRAMLLAQLKQELRSHASSSRSVH